MRVKPQTVRVGDSAVRGGSPRVPAWWNAPRQLPGADLPYADQANLYSQLRLEEQGQKKIVAAISGTPVPLYLCPSDPAPTTSPPVPTQLPPPEDFASAASTSYAGNSGTGVQADGCNGIFQHTRPVNQRYFPNGFVRTSDVRDGLANTAAVAEIRHGDSTFGDRLRVAWYTPRYLTRPSERDASVALCASIPEAPRAYGCRGNPFARGTPWTEGDLGMTMYNHLLTPNGLSCVNHTDWQRGAYTAGSYHAGGAWVLHADGHLAFVASAIDLAVWRELGSRVKRSVNEQYYHELEGD